MTRGTPYLRRRPSADRRLDDLWAVIRARRVLAPVEAAAAAGISDSYARHVMARLANEGVLTLISAAGRGDGGRLHSAVYELARDLGPAAPILVGGMRPAAAGLTDCNIAAPRAKPREARLMPAGNAPHEEARRRRLLLGLTQAQMGHRLGVSSDTVRRWETPPDRKRHEPISAARLRQMRELQTIQRHECPVGREKVPPAT